MEPNVISVEDELDIVTARQAGRQASRSLGFDLVDETRVTTAISELARNIVLYADKGTITLRKIRLGTCAGLEIIAEDKGPGIINIDLAMEDGYSTSKGLGAGLPGVRRLMDVFEIESSPGTGTTIRILKWAK